VSVLVAGGSADPNVECIRSALLDAGANVQSILVGKDANPVITWDLGSDELYIDDELIRPAAAFVRYDVFTSMETGSIASAARAKAWYLTVCGWIQSHPDVRFLNRGSLNAQTNKLAVLRFAKAAGLSVPQTVATNAQDRLGQLMSESSHIVKPVAGGAYTQRLGDVLGEAPVVGGALAMPAIVQPELVSPEVRVYRIRDDWFAFQIKSDTLDYRTSTATRLEYIGTPAPRLVHRLRRLLDGLSLDFAAVDFRTSRDSSELFFLEVNTMPMFSAFDHASKGAISSAMLSYLCNHSVPVSHQVRRT
jgi:hypothetical protein